MHEVSAAKDFIIWIWLWMDMTDAVLFLYTYIVKRVTEVAPPTAFGTEEWGTWAPVGI